MMGHTVKCCICGNLSDGRMAEADEFAFDASAPKDRLCPVCRKAIRDAKEQQESKRETD